MTPVITWLRRLAGRLLGPPAEPRLSFGAELRRALEQSQAVTIRLDSLERSRSFHNPRNDSNER